MKKIFLLFNLVYLFQNHAMDKRFHFLLFDENIFRLKQFQIIFSFKDATETSFNLHNLKSKVIRFIKPVSIATIYFNKNGSFDFDIFILEQGYSYTLKQSDQCPKDCEFTLHKNFIYKKLGKKD